VQWTQRTVLTALFTEREEDRRPFDVVNCVDDPRTIHRMVCMLIAKGADVNAAQPVRQRPALHDLACEPKGDRCACARSGN
jgi:hypothetical protein